MGTAEKTIFCALICLPAATATLSTTISPCSSTIWLRSRLQSSMLESRGLFRLVFIACNAVKSSILPPSPKCCREQANNSYLHSIASHLSGSYLTYVLNPSQILSQSSQPRFYGDVLPPDVPKIEPSPLTRELEASFRKKYVVDVCVSVESRTNMLAQAQHRCRAVLASRMPAWR